MLDMEIGERRRRQRSVLPAARLAALQARSDLQGALRAAIHVGLIVAGGTLVWLTRGTLWVWPAMLLQGLFVVTLFAAMHEAIHFTAFRSRWPNHLAGYFAGAAILFVTPFYRHFHTLHHRHTQDPARDPELLAAPIPRSRSAFWLRVTAIAYWQTRFTQLVSFALGRFEGAAFLDAAARAEVRIAARGLLLALCVALGLSLLFGSDLLFWCWLLPIVLGMPFLRCYLLCEHGGCEESDDALANTRTTLAAWPVRLLMWNMPYHAEHHLYPNIPFHALPATHRLLAPHLKVLASGYLPTLRSIYRGCSAAGAS